MFSYRHSFHAGSHADVLKHSILILLIEHFLQKQKSISLIDTHAGAGIYDLHSDHALTSQEWHNGIKKIWGHSNVSAPLKKYLNIISSFNSSQDLCCYPGSPAIAAQLLRSQDQAHFFELHPNDIPLLKANFGPSTPFSTSRIHVHAQNGFSALKSLLPPPSRRGLIFIDPSYEDKKDYMYVVQALSEGLARFATGTYAIWYPCLARYESRSFIKHLKQLPIQQWLQAEVKISTQKGVGLTHSGLFIINPPWTLQATLQTLLPELTLLLKLDSSASYHLEAQTQ